MIGWYVHHVGRGHAHRAEAVSRFLAGRVTGLSSLPRPRGWTGSWVRLPRDDDTTDDATAGGQLHWAPLHDVGLRRRMAMVSSWIEDEEPELVVSDVSVEITLLARLHGVRVVSVVLPGERSDPAHVLGYRVSDALVATWPPGTQAMVSGLPRDVAERLTCVGGLSRFDVGTAGPRAEGPARVTVLAGAGGTAATPALVASAKRETPGWRWDVLAPPPLGTWCDDPSRLLAESDVVVTHAGQNAIAEVAAARRPAIVVPEDRPHGEQAATSRELSNLRWPATVLPSWPTSGWPRLLGEASRLDGTSWSAWCDGGAAARFAEVIERTRLRDAGARAAG